MKFRRSQVWRQALATNDLHERNVIAGNAAATHTSGDLASLVELAGDGEPAERELALRLLAPVVRDREKAFGPYAIRMIEILKRNVADAYFQRPFGMLSWSLLYTLAQADAEAVVVRDIPLEGRSDAELARLVNDLGLLASSSTAAVSRLRHIARLSSSASEAARMRLRIHGHVSPAEVAEVARRWRTQRDRESLNWLYNGVILQQQSGASASRLLKLLGPPTYRYDEDYRWDTNERTPIQLMLVISKGRLQSWTLR
jgi:hypothetical protein